MALEVIVFWTYYGGRDLIGGMALPKSASYIARLFIRECRRDGIGGDTGPVFGDREDDG